MIIFIEFYFADYIKDSFMKSFFTFSLMFVLSLPSSFALDDSSADSRKKLSLKERRELQKKKYFKNKPAGIRPLFSVKSLVNKKKNVKRKDNFQDASTASASKNINPDIQKDLDDMMKKKSRRLANERDRRTQALLRNNKRQQRKRDYLRERYQAKIDAIKKQIIQDAINNNQPIPPPPGSNTDIVRID
jgi:hypothetical protein